MNNPGMRSMGARVLLRVFVAATAAASINVLAVTTPVRSETVTKPQAPTITKPQAPTMRAAANSPVVPAPAPAAQRSLSTTGEEIIARVGDTDIKEASLRTFVAGLGEREQAALARDPALLSQVVRSLLANQLVLKEAIAKRWISGQKWRNSFKEPVRLRSSILFAIDLATASRFSERYGNSKRL